MLPDGWLPLALVPFIAIGAARARAVAPDGACAGAVVAGALAFGLGWAGLAMLLALVVLGTMLSARGERRRDAIQVISNGAVAAVLGCVGAAGAAAAALSCALSDTGASEIGRRFGFGTRRLLFGAPVSRGSDGGMTWVGTLAGLLLAWPVPLLGWAFGALPGFGAASLVAAAGVCGNLLDSALGATVQARLGPRGNDAVNLIATAAAALLGAS